MEDLMINRSLIAREQATSPTDTARDLAARVPAPIEQILFEVKGAMVGQDRLLERLLIALLSGGHVLLEGVPGLAKTVTVKAFARVIGGAAGRIQFTPDLDPPDLIATGIYNPGRGDFSTELGPVFCNLLLADEINRAPAKVQSALLEAMQERQVTIGKDTHPLPEPFVVLATENPIETDGTYPLPEAQLDRFMLKVLVDYPSFQEEVVVVEGIASGVDAETIVKRVLERFPPPRIDLGDRVAS